MNEDKTGGAAFPSPGVIRQDGVHQGAYGGMTLRDYFAVRASEEDILAHSSKGFVEEYITESIDGFKRVSTRWATRTREQARYHYADAMLKERNK